MSIKTIVQGICRADVEVKKAAYYLMKKYKYRFVRFAYEGENMSFVCQNSSGALLSVGVVTAYGSNNHTNIFIPNLHNGKAVDGINTKQCLYVILRILRNDSCEYLMAPLSSYKELIKNKEYTRLQTATGAGGNTYSDFVFSFAKIRDRSMSIEKIIY